MSTDTKHSPTPWRVDSDNPNEIHGPRHFIGVLESDGSDAEDAANAALTVRCVNTHDALVEALAELVACKDHIHRRSPDTGNVPASDVRTHEKRIVKAYEAARAALALVK